MAPLIGLTTSTSASAGSYHTACGTNLSYVGWIERSGGAPILLPNTAPELVSRYLDAIDGLLLTGGYDIAPLLYGREPAKHLDQIDVLRDRFELPLAQAALERDLPIFAICRGIQTLNVAAGGTLRQDLQHDPIAAVQHRMKVIGGTTTHHTVSIEPDSLLHSILGEQTVAVNSYHHQAVDEPGEGLRATAYATDGTIEAIEGEGERFVLGVQWHPEVMTPDHQVARALFEAFAAACSRR